MLTDTLYKFGFILAVVAGVLFGAYTWHKGEVKVAEVKTAERVEKEFRLSMDEQRKRLTAKATEAETKLKEALGKNQQRKTNEITAIKSRTDSVAASVRDAVKTGNTSGSSIPNDPGKDSGSIASFDMRLSGTDAELLTKWFAGSAAELQAELKACQADFDVVRDKINTFKLENQK